MASWTEGDKSEVKRRTSKLERGPIREKEDTVKVGKNLHTRWSDN
jgi:hypothetical protein